MSFNQNGTNFEGDLWLAGEHYDLKVKVDGKTYRFETEVTSSNGVTTKGEGEFTIKSASSFSGSWTYNLYSKQTLLCSGRETFEGKGNAKKMTEASNSSQQNSVSKMADITGTWKLSSNVSRGSNFEVTADGTIPELRVTVPHTYGSCFGDLKVEFQNVKIDESNYSFTRCSS